MTASLAGKEALVTGGGTGIGAAIAEALAGRGARVSVAGRRPAPLSGVMDRLGSHAGLAVEMDVTCEESVAQAMRTLNAKVGAIDILVNNAGQAETAPFLKTDLAMWDRMLRVNLIGTYLVTRSVLPGMVEAKGGRIINVASSAGLVGYSYVSAYVAAKHAVIGLTRSLALEVVSHGITVNAVCPGYTDTPLVDRAIEAIAHKTGRTPSEAHASIVRTNPLGRLMRPGEVADAVSWLAGSGAAAITGQAISITGGEVMVG